MNFYINKNSTLPTLKMELIHDGRNDFSDFHECIQNANIYFCMEDVATGARKIGMKPATLYLKQTAADCQEEYILGYEWTARDTNKAGTYRGQFHIEFLDGTGTLIVPIREELYVHVLDGSIKR